MGLASVASLAYLEMNPEHALIADELGLLTMQVKVDSFVTPDVEGGSTIACDMDGKLQLLSVERRVVGNA